MEALVDHIVAQSRLYRQGACAWLQLLQSYRSPSGLQHAKTLNNVAKRLDRLKLEVLELQNTAFCDGNLEDKSDN